MDCTPGCTPDVIWKSMIAGWVLRKQCRPIKAGLLKYLLYIYLGCSSPIKETSLVPRGCTSLCGFPGWEPSYKPVIWNGHDRFASPKKSFLPHPEDLIRWCSNTSILGCSWSNLDINFLAWSCSRLAVLYWYLQVLRLQWPFTYVKQNKDLSSILIAFLAPWSIPTSPSYSPASLWVSWWQLVISHGSISTEYWSSNPANLRFWRNSPFWGPGFLGSIFRTIHNLKGSIESFSELLTFFVVLWNWPQLIKGTHMFVTNPCRKGYVA